MTSTTASSRQQQRLYERFGNALREARKGAGLTQDALAQRLGLSRTSVTNIERGAQPVALHTLVEIARALGVKPEDLVPAVGDTAEFAAVEADELLGSDFSASELHEWVSSVVRSAPGQP